MLNQFFDKYIFTNTLKYTHNNFFLVDVPFLIIPVDVLIEMIKSSDKEFRRKIYSMFKESTKKDLLPRFAKLGLEKNKKLDFVKTFFIASGWGKIDVIDLDVETKRAIIVLENSPFANELKGKVNFEVDIISRAILAGVFSEFFGEEIDCVEVECACMNKPACKLIIKPTAEFDLSKEIVQDQLPLGE